MSLKGYLEEFLLYLVSEKGAAEATLEAYGRDLKQFHAFLEQEKICSYAQVSENHLVSFLSDLQQKNYASSSINRAFVAVKVFFRFLKRENYIQNNPAKIVHFPKMWQTIPEVLSEAEVEAILKIPDLSTFSGCRDRVILELLYGTGLRVSELCKIHIEDIQEGFLRVFGKGSKERLVPVGKKAQEVLFLYQKKYRQVPVERRKELLFVSEKGKPITREMIWRLVKDYAKKAGILKAISPHSFRHTYATHLLDHGADVRVIQELLGHADIGSTDRYTHISHQHLIEAFRQFHPRK